MTTTDRTALKLFVLMFAGFAVTCVPGDNYGALRAIGYVALYGSWSWFLRENYRSGREWLRTHKLRDAIPWALELATYWLPLLFILTRDLPGWVKVAWCAGVIVVWAVVSTAAVVARALVREYRESRP